MRKFDFSLNFDGGAQPNPGTAGCGWVIKDNLQSRVVASGGKQVVIDGFPQVSNNQAEYHGLIEGLQECHNRGVRSLAVHGDSKLVINHTTEKWECREDHLKPLKSQVLQLASTFREIDFFYVPRDNNKAADKIANDFIRKAKAERALFESGVDYSAAWLAVLKDNKGNIEYHQQMLLVLDSIPVDLHKLAPGVPPPEFIAFSSSPNGYNSNYGRADSGASTSALAATAPSVSLTNAFSTLALDEDDDEEDEQVVFMPLTREALQTAAVVEGYNRRNNRNNKTTSNGTGSPLLAALKPEGRSSSSGPAAHQVRYLVVMAEMGLAEAKRKMAEECRDCAVMTGLWQEAYAILNDMLARTVDHWHAIVADYIQNGGTQHLDGHNLTALQDLLHNVGILCDHTEFERGKALRNLEFQLRKVQGKLNPLRTSRSDAKSRMGEERWNHNPAPKMDYAERMRLLADEQRALEDAIAAIASLQLRG